MSDLYLKQVEVGPMQNYAYAVGSYSAKAAFLVDPAWEWERLQEMVRADGLELAGVIQTHNHQDHVGGSLFGQYIPGLKELLEAWDAAHETPLPVYLNPAEYDWLPVEPKDRRGSEDGTVVRVGEVSITCVHTPGHTPGSQCLFINTPGEETASLITGDTLFAGACGRVDLPQSNPEEMHRTLYERLPALPPSTVVYPGHSYNGAQTTTLAKELATNPYMQFPSREAFLAAMR